MKLSDLKYLCGFLVPLVTFISLEFNGFWSFFCPVEAFIVIPILEQLFPRKDTNLNSSVEKEKEAVKFFDLILYLMVPVQFGLLFYYLFIVTHIDLTPLEITGKTLSMGISCGVLGINVAHELGHRSSKFEKALAKLLLLSSLYMHFIIEHNRGHHKNVSTDLDPASAKLNEPIFTFWFRSMIGGFISAWKLEALRLRRLNRKIISIHNEMIIFCLVQILFCLSIYILFNFYGLLFFAASALIGILLLETVNYIEHYGLRRKVIEDDMYEKVKPIHSWNSNHVLGRIMLFELTRHSDHHYKATRKYQVLRSFDNSPQLPLGYPASMILSLFPPLWFWLMNKRIKSISL